jgi:hypothetical protein
LSIAAHSLVSNWSLATVFSALSREGRGHAPEDLEADAVAWRPDGLLCPMRKELPEVAISKDSSGG